MFKLAVLKVFRMTSMATDGYPWGRWPPLHMQGPYVPPHWQGSMSSSGSCMYAMPPDYRNEKPPLTQLQELASVFPSPVKTETPAGSDHETGYMLDAHFRECDSGFGGKVERDFERDWCRRKPDTEREKREWHQRKTDSVESAVWHTRRADNAESPVWQQGKMDREPAEWYSSATPECKLETNAWLYSTKSEPGNSCCSERTSDNCDLQGTRECDSGFAQPFSTKEESDVFAELAAAAEGDSGCATDIPPPTGDSDSGCADLASQEDEPTSALPGFHQAFGSTEIGRFSRNDFFTNPSPPQVVEPPQPEPPRKTTRKPRSPRVKHVRKERPDSPKCKDLVPSVPIPEGAPCSPRVCVPPYHSAPCDPPKYCPEYSHPYVRSYPAPYTPYFRPFSPFPVDYGQSWHEPRWPPYHQPYQQSYQPQQWTSANVYPFMRLDY